MRFIKEPVEKAQEKSVEMMVTIHDATEVAMEAGEMRIHCTNSGTKWMYVPKIEDRRVVFSKNGFATVSDKLGCYLIGKYPAEIKEVKPTEIKKRKARKSTKSTGKVAPPEGTYHEADSEGQNKEGE